MGFTPLAAAPELNSNIKASALDETETQNHDLYSLGLLLFAVHLQVPNPLLHPTFASIAFNPSQATAIHWDSWATATGKRPSCLPESIFNEIQTLKADPSDQLLKDINRTFKRTESTECSKILKKAISFLCVRDPRARSGSSAMSIMQSCKPNCSHCQFKSLGPSSTLEEGWIQSLRPRSRMQSYNQHMSIEGMTL